MSALVVPVFAVENHGYAAEGHGSYSGILVGQAANIANIDSANSGASVGLLGGYQYNPLFATEGTFISLLDNAEYQTNTATTVTSGIKGSRSLYGAEGAGVFSLPFTDHFSFLTRLGYAYMRSTEKTSSALNNYATTTEATTIWKGPMYGFGLQYMFDMRNKTRVGFRAELDRYILKDPSGWLIETPSNAYLAGILVF